MTPEAVDVCDFDPGYEVAGEVTGRLRGLVQVWRGDLSGRGRCGRGRSRCTGPEAVRRQIPVWFAPSPFAVVPRAGAVAIH